MHLDPTNHEAARATIDKSLAGAASTEDEQSLREHLAACDPCSEYLDAGRRAIAALGGLCFDLDPALDRRVLAALELRAQQLEASRAPRARFAWACALALLLTVAGSFLAAQLGGHAAAAFHLDGTQVRLGLTTFWITPSLCVCLVLLLLPPLHCAGLNKKGLSL
jgi:predicted anti-sigma-YlaC factor YlaD